MIAHVAEALARDDAAAALAAAIAAWRATRVPALAELVDALAPPLAAIGDRRSEVARGRLAAVVAEVGVDDPRVATWLLDALARPPYGCSAGTRPFWRDVFAHATAIADPRVVVRADELEAAFATRFAGRGHGRDDMRRKLAKLIAAMRARYPDGAPALAPADAARVEAWIARARAPRVTDDGARLLAAIHADPADAGAREVYADQLGARGDVRGEAIALQLAEHAGRGTAAGRARVRALLAEHAATWLGPLATVVDPARVEYARGFAVRVRVTGPRGAVERVAREPAWSTIEVLEGADPATLAIVLARAPLPALHTIAARLDRAAVAAIAERGATLPRLAAIAIADHVLDRAWLATLATLAALPALARVEVWTRDPPDTRRVLAGRAAFAPLVELRGGDAAVPPLARLADGRLG